MNYQIITTLGPASADETLWNDLIGAGATGFRLNTSHLSLAQLHTWLERLTPFLAAQAAPIPLTLDLQGSKWRLGDFSAAAWWKGSQLNWCWPPPCLNPANCRCRMPIFSAPPRCQTATWC